MDWAKANTESERAIANKADEGQTSSVSEAEIQSHEENISRNGTTLNDTVTFADAEELRRILQKYLQGFQGVFQKTIADFIWIMGQENVITSDECQIFLQELLAKNDPRQSLFDIISESDDKKVRQVWKRLLKFQNIDPDLRKILNEILRTELKENVDSSQENTREASKENEQHQEDRSQSDNDCKQKLDADQDEAKSQPWTGQQPVTGSERAIANNANEVQPSSISEAGMQSHEENIGGNDFKENAGLPQEITLEASKENEQKQEDHSQPDNDSKHKLDADQDQPNSETWTEQWAATESKKYIANKADEVHSSSTAGAEEMQIPEENIVGCDFKENAGLPHEITQEASKENEQQQEDRNQPDNDSKHKLDADQDQPNSETWTEQWPATESEKYIANKADEVHSSPTAGAKMQIPEENIVGCGKTFCYNMLQKTECKEYDGSHQENNQETSKENDEHQEDRIPSDNNSKQKLDADQDQPISQPWTGQQPATECEETIANKVDEVQTLSTPGKEMQSPGENNVRNEFKEDDDLAQEITLDSSEQREEHQEDRNQSDNDSKQKLDADQDQDISLPWTGQKPETESERAIANKANEVESSPISDAEKQSPEENISGNDFKENAGLPHEITREASKENEQQEDRNQPDNDSKHKLDADQECKEYDGSPPENSQEIWKENDQHQEGRIRSDNNSNQKVDADQGHPFLSHGLGNSLLPNTKKPSPIKLLKFKHCQHQERRCKVLERTVLETSLKNMLVRVKKLSMKIQKVMNNTRKTAVNLIMIPSKSWMLIKTSPNHSHGLSISLLQKVKKTSPINLI
ncbi:uncharacterized protein LOC134339998 isoform X3 [Mobula hypostoma]|uniref:uncharacterized protein LOC134339998 isoform X3 n=1 Tax=Mobula hypostoma TaxID=723540 RepID=UPI002FC2EAFE